MKAWIFFFMPSVSEDTVTVTGVAGAVSWFTVMLRPGRVCLNSLVVDCTVMPLTVSSAFWAYCATEPEVAAPLNASAERLESPLASTVKPESAPVLRERRTRRSPWASLSTEATTPAPLLLMAWTTSSSLAPAAISISSGVPGLLNWVPFAFQAPMVMVSLPAPNCVSFGMMPVATDWLRASLFTEITEEPGSALASVTETRSEEHTSELQSQSNLVCRLLLEKKKKYMFRLPHERQLKLVYPYQLPGIR